MPEITFIDTSAREYTIDAPEGLSILEIAQEHDIDLEGSCGGSLACATCHVIVEGDWFDKTGEKTEDEEDMLDLAFDLQETSRLGCQILMNDALSGIRVKLPEGTRPLPKTN